MMAYYYFLLGVIIKKTFAEKYVLGGKHMKTLIKSVAISLLISSSAAFAETVAVITPYLAQPGTQAAIEGFEAAASDKGWDVNVIDTAGDIAAAISRIEDSCLLYTSPSPRDRG